MPSMSRLALCVLCAVLCLDVAGAHGAYYPPASSPPGPGPSNPGPSAPAPPGPAAPGLPPGPASGGANPPPSTPSGPASGGKSAGAKAPSTGGTSDPDPTSWESWWSFNRDRYLALKAHTTAREIATRSDEAFLGQGTPDRPAQGIVSAHVMPALRTLLEHERQQDVATGAMIALARMADGPLAAEAPELGRVFAAFTDDPNQEIAETSVVARGIAGDASSASELADLLEDGEAVRARHGGHAVGPRTRAFAGYALGLLGANTRNEDLRRFVVHHIVRTLREDKGAQPDVQVACVTALGLTPLEWSRDGSVKAPATPAAARRSTGTASASRETELDCLLALLSDTSGDRWARAHVPTALSRLSAGASPAVREEIARALLERIGPSAREKDEVVQGCVLALGGLGDADRDEIDVKVRNALKSAVDGADLQSKRFALIALAQCAARPGQKGNDEGAAEVRLFIASRLADGRSHERCWAALGLGVLEHERMLRGGEPGVNLRAQVQAALRDAGSGTEIGALAIAAGLMGDREATPILLARLERTADAATQGHIAVALGLLADARGAPALRAQLAAARFRPELLRETAIGLALMEDATLVPALVDTLEKASSLASQSAAASVLGWIGDRRTIDPLLVLLANTEATASARAFAAVALGRVCDQDRMPWNAVVAQDVHYRAATVTLRSADGTGLLDLL
jgi:hypothetical protein